MPEGRSMTEASDPDGARSKPTVTLHAFGRAVALERSLRPSEDVVLIDRPPASPDQVRQLEALYAEVCGSWRLLVDVRFKLLALVPAVSAVTLGVLLPSRREGEGLDAGAGLVIAIFGFVVTLALWIYDQRNSQLHDELVSRGRRIEYELGIGVGQFRGRPGSRGVVKHDIATAIVYVATLAAWLVAAVVLGGR
jgi:hypothetical protein